MVTASLLSLVAASAMLGQANTPPQVRILIPDEPIYPGAPVKASVEVTFADGLHGYQNPPSQDYQIPVTVSGGSDAPKVRKVWYPSGSLSSVGGETEASFVYNGTVTFPALVHAPHTAGKHEVAIRVRYQQCTDQVCFGPASVTAKATITVQDAPAGWNSVSQRLAWANALSQRKVAK